mmetsp:Transcript_41239/g.54247  ORF Transcript_41239/g.54247 Transcript_41239/m.54247 type:complete len:112 (+) Transcript_41239:68-403(+)
MDEAEFRAKLNRFPIVRDENYYRAIAKKQQVSQSSTSAGKSGKTIRSSKAPTSFDGVQAADNFWTALDQYLQASGCNVTEAKKFKEAFKEAHQDTFNSLCFDDFEDIAKLL